MLSGRLDGVRALGTDRANLPRDDCLTTRRVRHRREEIQGTRFRVKVVAEARMFGLVDVWRAQNQVKVSNPARTIVDLLDDPALGGGMRHVAEVMRNYFEGIPKR